MIDLKDYIYKPEWDCHIHNVFGRRKILNHDNIARNNIRMVNYLLGDKDFSIYRDLQLTAPQKGDILLLNAIDPDEMRKALKDMSYPGIGEINVQKTYKDPESGEILGFWDTSILDELRNDKRPVFLHWDMEKPEDYSSIEAFLRSFPDKKFVLCHMGGNYFLQNREVLSKVPELMTYNNNLWTDISWSTLTWVEENPSVINKLDKNRVLVGSDLCRDSINVREMRTRQLLKFQKDFPIQKNVGALFNISFAHGINN